MGNGVITLHWIELIIIGIVVPVISSYTTFKVSSKVKISGLCRAVGELRQAIGGIDERIAHKILDHDKTMESITEVEDKALELRLTRQWEAIKSLEDRCMTTKEHALICRNASGEIKSFMTDSVNLLSQQIAKLLGAVEQMEKRQTDIHNHWETMMKAGRGPFS